MLEGAAAAPPVDWRGPGALDPRSPPPPDWRGPNDIPRDWRGPPGYSEGPPGFYPPPRPGAPWYEHPPPRPMGYPVPPPGSMGQRQGPPLNGPPRQDYGWHMGMPPRSDEAGRYRDQPPIEWRGPGAMQRSPYPPGHGEAAGAWQPPASPPAHWGGSPPGEAPGYPGYHGAHVGYTRDTAGGEADKGSSTAAPGAGGGGAAAGTALPALGNAGDAQAQGGTGAGRRANEDAEVREDDLPAPPTVAERMRGVPLVRGALSERMLSRLRALGLLSEEPTPPLFSPGVGELGTSGEAPAVAAAVREKCERLGLDGSVRAKLPPATPPGPPRLPACTVGLAQHSGLWERFRQRCDTPVATEAPPIPCQLRASAGGGQVVAPLLILGGASICA